MLKFVWEISGLCQKMFLEVDGGRKVCVCAGQLVRACCFV